MLFSLRHFSLLVNFFNKDLILFPPPMARYPSHMPRVGWYFGPQKGRTSPLFPADIVEKKNFLALINKIQQDPPCIEGL